MIPPTLFETLISAIVWATAVIAGCVIAYLTIKDTDI